LLDFERVAPLAECLVRSKFSEVRGRGAREGFVEDRGCEDDVSALDRGFEGGEVIDVSWDDGDPFGDQGETGGLAGVS
jgi:hypothetical protein